MSGQVFRPMQSSETFFHRGSKAPAARRSVEVYTGGESVASITVLASSVPADTGPGRLELSPRPFEPHAEFDLTKRASKGDYFLIASAS